MAEKSTPKSRKKLTAAEMALQQREISVSEFFTKNRHLLGFDNPKRALLTTVKEAVDNSLDACEDAGILPEVWVEVEQTSAEDRFQVRVRDNGPGIVQEQIPRIFGKLLYGSKFHRLKMSRGQQGIGISAAGMYGHLTTGQPITIISRTAPAEPAHFYQIVIDTKQNEPKILRVQEVEWQPEQGTQVQIELEGIYQRGKWSVDEYLEQTATANPHVTMHYAAPDGKKRDFRRVSSELPAEPKEIKPHPHGIELGILIKMLQETRSRTLKTFLQNDFCRVSSRSALQICELAGLYENARPKRIATKNAQKLLKAIRNTKLRNPPMDCIAPIEPELIKAGMRKEFKADFYTAITRKPTVYRGIPFVIEAGLAYGGALKQETCAKLMRFANRVPLLYNSGAGVIKQAIASANWKQYGIEQSNGSLPAGPLLILVHMASPWVPFTSESKEAIACYPKIEKEIVLALQECTRPLRRFLRQKQRNIEERRKHKYIEKYIPHIGVALQEILQFSDGEREHVIENLSVVLQKSRAG
ncbi:MAG: DNA topoisomerase VI subunit B [Planctomycetes bacterium]|nr:DNA topoisomerase VI subunit B [Planctomycetota bacterium]